MAAPKHKSKRLTSSAKSTSLLRAIRGLPGSKIITISMQNKSASISMSAQGVLGLGRGEEKQFGELIDAGLKMGGAVKIECAKPSSQTEVFGVLLDPDLGQWMRIASGNMQQAYLAQKPQNSPIDPNIVFGEWP